MGVVSDLIPYRDSENGSETAKSLRECKVVPPCAEHKEILSTKSETLDFGNGY
jgi:hypothetical protein